MYDIASAIAANLPSPGFELHLGNAAEEADEATWNPWWMFAVITEALLIAHYYMSFVLVVWLCGLSVLVGVLVLWNTYINPYVRTCIWFTYPYTHTINTIKQISYGLLITFQMVKVTG